MTDFAGDDIVIKADVDTSLTDDADTQRPAEKAYLGIRQAILDRIPQEEDDGAGDAEDAVD